MLIRLTVLGIPPAPTRPSTTAERTAVSTEKSEVAMNEGKHSGRMAPPTTAPREAPAAFNATPGRGLVVFQVMAENELDAFVYPTFDHSATVIPEGILEGASDDHGKGSNRGLSRWIGFPALTGAAGFTEDDQPVGIDLMGRPYSEGMLFALGCAFEQGTDHRRWPALTPALN